MSRRIYLDMDGPLCHMVLASLDRLKHLLPVDFTWPAGVWDYTKATGIPASTVWSHLEDHEYWADEIQPTPWARELVNTAVELVGIKNVRIATKPVLSPWSASGKMAWIQRHFPELSRQFAIIIDKAELAGPGHVLVDDSETNVEAFQAAGGDVVLWPCPQNRRHADDPRVGLAELRDLFKPAEEYTYPLSVESGILEVLADASVLLRDGFGSEICMPGGNVETTVSDPVYWEPRYEV